MRMLGLIGGMSWESTALYYRHLNQLVGQRCGGLHSARLLLWSVDFAEIAALQHDDHWDEAGRMLAEAARRLEGAGAEAIVLCTNTMHKVAETIAAGLSVPLLHIASSTAVAVRASGSRRPALLATRFTMEQDFLSGRLREPHGIDVMVPEEPGRTMLHRIIYEELCQGIVNAHSRDLCVAEIERLQVAGADAVILGCTELTMLIGAGDVTLPLFDTTLIHATAAADFALAV